MSRVTAKDHQGFTLIELMITVTIISILAAVALPGYQNYAIKAQISEGLTLSEGMKTAIAEYFKDRGSWPATHTTLGLAADTTGSYVSSISSTSGQITIIYGNRAHEKIKRAGANTLTITATVQNVDNSQIVSWICGYATPPAGGVVSPSTQVTTVAADYLPPACRE